VIFNKGSEKEEDEVATTNVALEFRVKPPIKLKLHQWKRYKRREGKSGTTDGGRCGLLIESESAELTHG